MNEDEDMVISPGDVVTLKYYTRPVMVVTRVYEESHGLQNEVEVSWVTSSDKIKTKIVDIEALVHHETND